MSCTACVFYMYSVDLIFLPQGWVKLRQGKGVREFNVLTLQKGPAEQFRHTVTFESPVQFLVG